MKLKYKKKMAKELERITKCYTPHRVDLVGLNMNVIQPNAYII